MTSPQVTIAIPTMRRAASLKRAVDSVLSQTGVDLDTIEILVVDNDPDASARDLIATYASCPVTVVYGHEPEPGVANARNLILEMARAPLIAFLDDDQSASPDWLHHLLAAYSTYKPMITFGPVETALPDDAHPHAEYLKDFFSRIGPENSGIYDEFYGCGNSLFDMSQFKNYMPLFGAESNETGGEDDRLFSRLDQDGHKFGWAAGAIVMEHVPESRANLRYTLRRTFAYGQAPSVMSVQRRTPDLFGLIFWMLVGVAQAGIYGLISGLMWVVRLPRRAYWLDRAVQGLGKIFRFGPFAQKFYGRSAL